MNPEELSLYLRTGDDLYLWCRRALVVTSFISIACMMIVGIYQMGLVKHLPEPRWRFFNADRVDAAPEAYDRMNLPMPDAFLGLVSYAVTVALVSLGGADRFARWPWLLIPLAMGLKLLVDAVQAGRLTWEQWALHREFCSWCLVAALASLVAVPLAVPETWAALKRLFTHIAG